MSIEHLENGYSATRFRSMNSTVEVTLDMDAASFERVLAEVVHPFFETFEYECSRFIENNPLATVNREPTTTHEVSAELFVAVRAAYEAYQLTDGDFDPRIMQALTRVGYAHSFQPDAQASRAQIPVIPRTEWTPELVETPNGGIVNLGGQAIDLGGIGKGLAVDLISATLKSHSNSGLVNAGGDLQAWGVNPDGESWRVGIEDPLAHEGSDPVAVLQISNTGLATSSTRRRRWTSPEGIATHHVIDPKTGTSTEESVLSVTVLHQNTRAAETLTKAIMIAGAENAARAAAHYDVPVLWVTNDGQHHTNEALNEHILWERSS